MGIQSTRYITRQDAIDRIVCVASLIIIKDYLELEGITFEEGNDYYTYVGGNKIKGTDLWKVLKKYCEMLFSRALAEALSKSREKEKGNRGVSFYDFDAGTS